MPSWLLACLAARAEPVALRVPPEQVEAVSAAAAAFWPGGAVVEAGAEPPADGFLLADGALGWWRGGALVRSAEVPDAQTAVVLARSWGATDTSLEALVPPAAEPAGDVAPIVPVTGAPQRPDHGRRWVGLVAVAPLGDAPAGARFAVAWALRPVELDLGLWLAAPPAAGVTRVERTAAAWVDAVTDLGLPRRVPGRPTLAPVAWLGVEAGPTVRRGEVPDPAPYLGATAHAGAGFDAWAGSAAGARIGAQLAPDALDLDVQVGLALEISGTRAPR